MTTGPITDDELEQICWRADHIVDERRPDLLRLLAELRQARAKRDEARATYERLATDHHDLAVRYAAGYDAAFAVGRRAGLEEAAQVCDKRAEKHLAEYQRGHGSRSWNTNTEQRLEADECATQIRALQRAAPAERTGE